MENIFGNTPFWDFLLAAVPQSALPTTLAPHIRVAKDTAPARIRLISLAGFFASTFLASQLSFCLRASEAAASSRGILLPATVAAWTVALCSFYTDVLTAVLTPDSVRGPVILLKNSLRIASELT